MHHALRSVALMAAAATVTDTRDGAVSVPGCVCTGLCVYRAVCAPGCVCTGLCVYRAVYILCITTS